MTTLTPSLGTWSRTNALHTSVVDAQVILIPQRNQIHLIGGNTESGLTAAVRSSQVDADGRMGKWMFSEALPNPLFKAQSMCTDKAIYLAGGYTASGPTQKVLASRLDAQGAPTLWLEQPSLPAPVSSGAVFTHHRHLYILGGFTGSKVTDQVHMSRINEDTSLNRWESIAHLPTPLWSPNVFLTLSHLTGKTRVNVLGCTDTYPATSAMYSAEINLDGTLTPWETGHALPNSTSSASHLNIAGYVYVMGGIEDCNASAKVYRAKVGIDGQLDEWMAVTPLPGTLSGACAVVIKNKVYLIGGIYNNKATAMVLASTVKLNPMKETKPPKLDKPPKVVFPSNRWSHDLQAQYQSRFN